MSDAKICPRDTKKINGKCIKTRGLEMAVGKPDGTWYTTFVDIPINTPIKKIENIAIKKLIKELEGEEASFINVHWIPPIEKE